MNDNFFFIIHIMSLLLANKGKSQGFRVCLRAYSILTCFKIQSLEKENPHLFKVGFCEQAA